ncbi:E3 ubiquitin-protein ligase TRIM33-like [Ruditapes philippinarum]|uniref:E3 ubiquitin-protein ligase TRIM33-like n=1 Tax=Ruditapes philippinarum TaxID=129788 RepID=UPI00295B365C|nr:E3 ubiquitin-protein ligase TRIM33-like [Ruditapes philippinarum]
MSYDSSMNINICKPCQDDSNETLADGWCRECDEYMCTTCFRHHCKSKFCKEHVLLEKKSTSPNSLNQSVEGLEKCKQHSKKSVKFYCAAHNMCGCSVCMIIEHKACDVVYIPQKAAEFESSKDVKSFEENLQKCSSQITACLSEIRNNIDANLNVHDQFTLDVQEFRDSLIDHVNQLAADICAESNELKDKSVQEQTELKSKTTVVQRNLQSMEESFKADKCQPNKLFVKFESLKNALEEISTTIRDLRKQNTTERYLFRKDSLIESVLDKCRSIGYIKFKNDEVDAGSDFILENAMPGNGKQSRGLKDLTQRVEFLQIDDDCLRYTHFGDSNGIFLVTPK